MINFLFSNAFKLEAEEEHREVFKSLGIDKEGGFVFSIDTMQVFFFRKKTHFQFREGFKKKTGKKRSG